MATTTPSWMNYQAPTTTEPMTGALLEGGNWNLVPSRFLAPNSVSMGPNLEGVDYAGYLAWEEQQRQQQQQQQLYDAYSQAFQKVGNTAASYTPTQGQPPKWEDFYNQFDQAHRARFGIGLDRPWTSDLGAINQKAVIDKQFLDALNKYNQTFGTQLQPNEQYLGPAAQPNTYTPKRNRGGGIGGVIEGAMGVMGGIADPAMKAVGSVINPVAEASGKAMGSIQGALDPVYNVGQTLIGERGPTVLPLIASAMGMPNPFALGGLEGTGAAAGTAGSGAATMADLVPGNAPLLTPEATANAALLDTVTPGMTFGSTGTPIIELSTPAIPVNPADAGLAGIIKQIPGLISTLPGAASNLGRDALNLVGLNTLADKVGGLGGNNGGGRGGRGVSLTDMAAILGGTALVSELFGGDEPARPDLQPLTAATQEASGLAQGLSQRQLGEAERQYGAEKLIADEVSGRQLRSSRELEQQVADLYAQGLRGRELEDALRAEALDPTSIARNAAERALITGPEADIYAARQGDIDWQVGQALADARRGAGRTTAQMYREGLRYGLSPQAMAARMSPYAFQQAGAEAAAANQARTAGIAQARGLLGQGREMRIADEGRRTERLTNAANMYRPYYGLSQSAAGLSSNLGTTALNTAMAPGAKYLGGLAQGAGTAMQGAGLKMTGLGNILNTQMGLYGADKQAQATKAAGIGQLAGTLGTMYALG